MIKQGGVYQIVNTENGKRYIGSAKCFRVRRGVHFRLLAADNHHAYKMQVEWSHYPAEAFKFEILLICAPKDCLYYEQKFLDFFKPEYNVNPTAQSRFGARNTAEHCRKISEAHKGKTYDAARNEQIRATLLEKDPGKRYKCNGKVMSIRKASDVFGISYNVLQHRVKIYGSLQAAVDHIPASVDEIRQKAYESSRANATRVECNGEFKSIPEWAKFFGVNRTVLYKKVHKGMTVEQAIASFKAPLTITLDGVTKAVTEWAAETGLTMNTIKGRLKRGWSARDTLTIPRGKQGMDVRKSYHIDSQAQQSIGV